MIRRKNYHIAFISASYKWELLQEVRLSKIWIQALLCLLTMLGMNSEIHAQIPASVISFEGHNGILIPRLSTDGVSAISDPMDGLLVYDSTLHYFFYYHGHSNSWRRISLEPATKVSRSLEELAPPHQPSFESDWNVEGNIGANQYSDDPPLLGTTDQFPVVFITDDQERMRIMADGNIAIVRSLEVGENLLVKQNVNLNTVGGETTNNGPFTVTDKNPSVLSGSLTSNLNVDLNTEGGQTFNHGPFTVNNQSPSLLTGILTVDQKTLLNLGLEVNGSSLLHGLFKVDNNKTSLFTGPVTVSDPSQSAGGSTSSGALVITGGSGIGKNLNVGGNLDIKGSSAFGGPVAFSSPVTINATEESTGTSNGALIVAGGVGIAKRLNVGGAARLESTLDVDGPTTLNNTLGVDGTTSLGSTLHVTGATTMSSTLGVTGATTLNSTLGVTGGTMLGSTLGVGGATTLGGTLSVQGATTLNNTLGVIGATTLESTLAEAGNFAVNTSKFTVLAANGNTNISGTLGVTGSTSFNRTLGVTGSTMLNSSMTVGGKTTLNSTLTVLGNFALNNSLTINANLPNSANISSPSSYPLLVKGSDQGIAIAINGSRTRANNFMSFWDGNGTTMWGRIEGQVLADLENGTDPKHSRVQDELDLAVTISSIKVATATVSLVVASTTLGGAIASATFCGGFAACITAPIPSLIVASAFRVASKTADLVATGIGLDKANERRKLYELQKIQNVGVTYQSGAGDYAEWLPKAQKEDRVIPGFVVGLKNGKISLTTEGADKILAISTNPIVLGNMPPRERESEFAKVAFMGQVPVHVMGRVEMGDYILPSGNNDGLGRAVPPTEMTAEDYAKIVGMAWSSSQNDVYNQINVAIGLNEGDISQLVSKQEKEIEELRQKFSELRRVRAERNVLLAKLVPGYKEALNISEDEINSIERRVVHKDQDLSVDEIIEIESPDPTALVYFEVTIEQVQMGVDLAERSFIENGGDVNIHPFWKKMKSDMGYKEKVIREMHQTMQKAVSVNKAIDRQNANEF